MINPPNVACINCDRDTVDGHFLCPRCREDRDSLVKRLASTALTRMNEEERTRPLMTLDEAIKHAEERVDTTRCGREHNQLADWLKELRYLRTRE